jgi:hypothetical protein
LPSEGGDGFVNVVAEEAASYGKGSGLVVEAEASAGFEGILIADEGDASGAKRTPEEADEMASRPTVPADERHAAAVGGAAGEIGGVAHGSPRLYAASASVGYDRC